MQWTYASKLTILLALPARVLIPILSCNVKVSNDISPNGVPQNNSRSKNDTCLKGFISVQRVVFSKCSVAEVCTSTDLPKSHKSMVHFIGQGYYSISMLGGSSYNCIVKKNMHYNSMRVARRMKKNMGQTNKSLVKKHTTYADGYPVKLHQQEDISRRPIVQQRFQIRSGDTSNWTEQCYWLGCCVCCLVRPCVLTSSTASPLKLLSLRVDASPNDLKHLQVNMCRLDLHS